MSIKEKLRSTLKFKYQTDLTGPNVLTSIQYNYQFKYTEVKLKFK